MIFFFYLILLLSLFVLVCFVDSLEKFIAKILFDTDVRTPPPPLTHTHPISSF